MNLSSLESLFFKSPYGAASRIRIRILRMFGLKVGKANRIEQIRCRRLNQISIGDNNAFTEGCWLWPEDAEYEGIRILIGNNNYFNRSVMIDSCGYIEIGSGNMFGPDVYITDSNHTTGLGVIVSKQPMQ